jgi:hypothetical protein
MVVPVVTAVPVVTPVAARRTARRVVMVVPVVPQAVVVPVEPAVRRCRAPVVRAARVVTPGPRAMVGSELRAATAQSMCVTAWTVARAVPAVPAAMVVLPESVALPRAMVVPRARRAPSAWLPMAGSALPALPVVPAGTPRV